MKRGRNPGVGLRLMMCVPSHRICLFPVSLSVYICLFVFVVSYLLVYFSAYAMLYADIRIPLHGYRCFLFSLLPTQQMFTLNAFMYIVLAVVLFVVSAFVSSVQFVWSWIKGCLDVAARCKNMQFGMWQIVLYVLMMKLYVL